MNRQSILFLIFLSIVLYFSDYYCYGQDQDTIVYLSVDSFPQFRYINCETNAACIDSFILKNIIWPVSEWDLKGGVYVQCVVEKDGTLSNLKLLRGIGNEFDKASINVIKLMPKWSPGKLNGKIVRSQIIIPVKWTLY